MAGVLSRWSSHVSTRRRHLIRSVPFECWKWSSGWETRFRIPELVEERVLAGRLWCWPRRRRILDDLRDEIDGLGGGVHTEHLVPRVRLDLREFELLVVRIHALNLFACRRAQHLDNLHQLIDSRVSREDWLSEEELSHDGSRRPHVNRVGVVGGAEDELWSAVVARADVRDVGLVAHQVLGRAEITQLQNSSFGVDEQVLGLDVAMADADAVDVGEGAKELVHVEFHVDHWDLLPLFGVVPGDSVHRLRNVFEYQVQIELVLLVAARVEEVLEFDNVWMVELSHDLKLAILESLVLKHLLDGHHLVGGGEFGEEDDAERAVSNDFLVIVGDFDLLVDSICCNRGHHHGDLFAAFQRARQELLIHR